MNSTLNTIIFLTIFISCMTRICHASDSIGKKRKNAQISGPISENIIGHKDKKLAAEQIRYTIVTTEGNEYTLENFLYLPERIQVLKIENIDIMPMERPSDFLNVLMKTFPCQLENIEDSFELFYKETFQIDNLILSLPSFQESHKQLAGILLELIIWCEILPPVEAQVENLLNLDKDHIRLLSRDLFWDQVGNQIGTQIGRLVENEVGKQALIKILTEFKNSLHHLIEIQVRHHVWSRLNEDLHSFRHESEYNDRTLVEALATVFTIYQLGTFTIRHSDEFKEIHNMLAHVILNKISDNNKVELILKSIQIPKSPEKNYFIDTQIKLIKRFLPLEDQPLRFY